MIRLPSLRRARRAAVLAAPVRAAVVEAVETRRLMTALDPSYNVGGYARVQPAAADGNFVLVDSLPDGRAISVCQTADAATGQPISFEISRLTTTGQTDFTFGTSGHATITLPLAATESLLTASASLASDGSILIAYSTSDSEAPVTLTHVSRVKADGTLQADFAGDGSLEVTDNATISRVSIATRGDELYIGYAGYVADSSATETALWVENASLSTGALDTSFGAGGTAIASVGVNDGMVSLAATAAGVAGFVATSAGLEAAAFDATGSLVATGQAAAPAGLGLTNALATPTGYLLAGNDGGANHLFEFDSNLNLGTAIGHKTFSDAGFQAYYDGDHTHALARDSAGKIYLGGFTPDDATGGLTDSLARLNADGTLDTSFGTNGVFYFFTDASVSAATSVTVLASDAVLVGSFVYRDDGTQAADFYKIAGNPVTPPPALPYTISNGTLSLVAGGGNDTITLAGSPGNYTLTVNGVSYVIAGSVTGVKIDGGAGNDTIKIANNITIPVTLIGGEGDDSLRGGAGDDVIDGGTGNDALVGGAGRDFMIGGAGADYLVGLVGDDILLNGTTSLDLAGIKNVMAEWTSNHTLLVKVANLSGLLPLPGRLNGNSYLTPEVTIFNDTAVDTLSGGDGTDFAYAQIWGQNADVVRDNLKTFRADVMALIAN